MNPQAIDAFIDPITISFTFEGMDHREIAAATGLQPLSIRILLHRARHKAAALLNPTPSATRSPQP